MNSQYQPDIATLDTGSFCGSALSAGLSSDAQQLPVLSKHTSFSWYKACVFLILYVKKLSFFGGSVYMFPAINFIGLLVHAIYDAVCFIFIPWCWFYFQPAKPDDLCVLCYTSGTTGNILHYNEQDVKTKTCHTSLFMTVCTIYMHCCDRDILHMNVSMYRERN